MLLLTWEGGPMAVDDGVFGLFSPNVYTYFELLPFLLSSDSFSIVLKFSSADVSIAISVHIVKASSV